MGLFKKLFKRGGAGREPPKRGEPARRNLKREEWENNWAVKQTFNISLEVGGKRVPYSFENVNFHEAELIADAFKHLQEFNRVQEAMVKKWEFTTALRFLVEGGQRGMASNLITPYTRKFSEMHTQKGIAAALPQLEAVVELADAAKDYIVLDSMRKTANDEVLKQKKAGNNALADRLRKVADTAIKAMEEARGYQTIFKLQAESAAQAKERFEEIKRKIEKKRA